MYDEKSDFLHHKKEVDDFFSSFASLGITLDRRMKVLDIGGGQGMHAGLLTRDFNNVFCCDVINYTSLYGGEFPKLLSEKYERNGYELHLENLQFIKSDGMDLIFKDSSFDIILSLNSFEHIPDPGRALREMMRCTKFGGFIYIQFDPIWTADTGSHFFHRVPEPWAHLVYSDEEYVSRMRENGASGEEATEFRTAMNRKRKRYYQDLFLRQEQRGAIKMLHETFWSGLSDERHRDHPFLGVSLNRGYSKDELFLRGGRFLMQMRQRTA